MSSSKLQAKPRSRRMIPALGTFVRLELDRETALFIHYSNLVFEEFKRVEKLFSVFDSESEVFRLNQSCTGKWVEMSPEVSNLLKLAQSITEQSKGAFDLGAQLEFEEDRVRKIQVDLKTLDRAAVDLGGIAKGYAVDCAVKLLFRARQEEGIDKIYGSLNAGGDLFLFEAEPTLVGLKSDLNSGHLDAKFSLTYGAVATSSTSAYSDASANYRGKTALRKSVSVFADQAVYADALTKVALFSSDRALFKTYGAKVIHEI